MPGHVGFEFLIARGTPEPARRGDRMRILVLGDFRGAARVADNHDRGAPLAVDIDNLDTRMAALSPAADVTDAAGRQHRIGLSSLEHFHPDSIFAEVDGFGTAAASTPDEPADAPAETSEDTFSRLLGQPADGPKQSRTKGMLDNFIEKLVEPEIVADDRQRVASAAGAAAAWTEQMRAILHAPEFQQIEATWRGLDDLVSELETGEELSVHMLDTSLASLRDDLDAEDFRDSDLYRTLVSEDRGRFGGQAWHIIACDFAFDNGDIRRLGNLAAIAAAAGGVILAGAGTLADHDPPAAEPDWSALRALPVARNIGIAAPRVLLRLPYGAKSDPIDRFAFEECVGRPDDSELLWGSPAMLLARHLGQTFLAHGWNMSPGAQITIADRPAYVFAEGGEKHLANCAERVMSDSEAEALQNSTGVMPIIAQRDGNRLLVPRIQSIADPAAALRGAWG